MVKLVKLINNSLSGNPVMNILFKWVITNKIILNWLLLDIINTCRKLLQMISYPNFSSKLSLQKIYAT